MKKYTFFSDNSDELSGIDYVPKYRYRIKEKTSGYRCNFTACYAGSSPIHQQTIAATSYNTSNWMSFGMQLAMLGVGCATGFGLLAYTIFVLEDTVSAINGIVTNTEPVYSLASILFFGGLSTGAVCWYAQPDFKKVRKEALKNLLQQADQEVDKRIEASLPPRP